MELKEMIKVMQHYKDGSTVELAERGNDDWEIIDFPLWNWADYNYRIKEPKQKVTIEKWLCKDKQGEYAVIDSSNVDKYTPYKKVKLMEIYEVEL